MSDTPQPTPAPPADAAGEAIGLPINHSSESTHQSGEVTITPVEPNTQLVTQVPAEPEADRTIFMPPIDIYDSGEGLVLLADLPGVTIESLEIQVQDNRLTLYGRVTPVLPPKAQLLHQEFEWGDFLRSFILSDEVDHDRITAKLNNGVLEVFLPRTPKAEPRRIQVNRE